MTNLTERTFMPDTSVLVPAIQSLLPDHPACAREIETRLTRGEAMVLAAHSLVETYSVLTRLPRGLRLAPAVALESIEQGLLTAGRVVWHDQASTLDLLHNAARAGVTGGSVYDFAIASVAVQSSVDALITLNTRDFRSFSLPLKVLAPAPV